jgi:hypothetical protein
MQEKIINPTIYLHIGTAKTGTSAIQNFIVSNSDRFIENGIYYPKTGRVNNCHHGIAFYWSNNNAYKIDFNIPEDQLTRLSEELNLLKSKNILISSECLGMSEVSWEELISTFPHTNVKIIIYFRRQDQFLASRYMELVKGNQIIQTPDEWIENNLFPKEYIEILQGLEAYFDKKNIIIRIYEQGQFVGGSIFSDFCNIFPISLTKEFLIPNINFNPHLSRNALEFNRMINAVFDQYYEPYLFSDQLTNFSLSEKSNTNKAFQEQNIFSPDTCRKILAACEQTNKLIAKEYLGREDECLFYEQPTLSDHSWKDYPGLSSEKIEEIATFLFNNEPSLVDLLLNKLNSATSTNQYLIDAKEKLIPILKKVIKK